MGTFGKAIEHFLAADRISALPENALTLLTS
jgi:hypothetical protein